MAKKGENSNGTQVHGRPRFIAKEKDINLHTDRVNP